MKRLLTVTMEFEDNPYDEETGQNITFDVLDYAMDIICESTSGLADLVDAKLDGELLVDRNGFVSEEVKKLGRHRTLEDMGLV